MNWYTWNWDTMGRVFNGRGHMDLGHNGPCIHGPGHNGPCIHGTGTHGTGTHWAVYSLDWDTWNWDTLGRVLMGLGHNGPCIHGIGTHGTGTQWAVYRWA